MWLYLLLFFIPTIAYLYQPREMARNVRFLAAYLCFLAFFVGFSDMFGGYDRYIYGEVFDSIANVTTRGGNYRTEGSFDFFAGESGYTWFNIVVSWFTANRYIFILVLTLVVYALFFESLKRYANNYPLALVLFMGLWFYFTFTYLRQVLGATIAWLSIGYIINRKLWKFLAVWLIAWSFHKSAIVFLPLYFVPIRKYPSNQVIYVMIAMAILGLSPIPNALFSVYTDNSVVEQQGDYSSEGGARIAYLLEAGFFLFIILKNYRYIPQTGQSIVLLNMALVFCAMLLFFIRSSNGGRLTWYYMIGLIVTFCNLLTRSVRLKSWAYAMIVVCLLLNLRIFRAWLPYGNLYPYKTFFTNGNRGDYSWRHFEYDHGYDLDKLYRPVFRVKINAGNGNIFGSSDINKRKRIRKEG